MADVPSYAVRDGRADSLDLGALLGNDSLSTALNARFTGSLSGTTLDSLLARLQLELLPSRVNDAELGPGRLTVGLDRGALEGDLRLQGEDAAATAAFKGRVGAEESRVRADGDLRARAAGALDPRHGGRRASRGPLRSRRRGRQQRPCRRWAGRSRRWEGSAACDCSSSTRRSGRRPGPSSWTRWSCDPTRSLLDGGGRIALRSGPSAARDTLRITGRTGDLTPLALLAGADSVVMDSTLLDLTVTGPPERRKIEGHADAFRLLYAGTLAERLTAQGSANDGQRRQGRVRRAAAGHRRRRRQAVGARHRPRRPLRLGRRAPGHHRRQRRHRPRTRPGGTRGRRQHRRDPPAARSP